MELAQKHAINEKSTIFVQIQWNLVRLTHAWVGQIGKVSLNLDKNCGFFINSIFLIQSHFLLPSLYLCLIFHSQNSARTPFQVGNNIVALIPGKHYNTTNDQIVVIGAHWDTYGLSPGLNDNGSGVASLLEVARVLGNEIFLFVKTSN